MKRLGSIFVIVSAPVLAQSSATTCYLGGAIVSCSTADARPQPALPDYALPDAGQMMQDHQRQDAEIASLRAAVRAQELRERVGRRLAKGNCADAEKAALEGGDLDLAAKVKAYCAAK